MIMKHLFFGLFFASVFWLSHGQDDITRLRSDLLENYDSFRIPSPGSKNGTVVKLGLNVRGFEIDEKYVVMILNCWIMMSWVDPRFQWDPSQYGNIKMIRFMPLEIWIPDIIPYTSTEANTAAPVYQMTNVVVNETGGIIWVPPATPKIKCKSEAYWWPRDKLVCQLKMGSWTYSAYDVGIDYQDSSEAEEERITQDGDWKIESLEEKIVTKHYSCCEEPYTHMLWTITLQRQGIFHMATLGTILIVVVVLTLLLFLFPSGSAAKFPIILFNLLLLSAMLFFCNINVPIPEVYGTPAAMRLIIGLAAVQLIILIVQIFIHNFLSKNVEESPLNPILSQIKWSKDQENPKQEKSQSGNSLDAKAARINQVGFGVTFIIVLIICICLWTF